MAEVGFDGILIELVALFLLACYCSCDVLDLKQNEIICGHKLQLYFFELYFEVFVLVAFRCFRANLDYLPLGLLELEIGRTLSPTDSTIFSSNQESFVLIF